MTAATQRGITTVSERAVRRITERATAEALPTREAARTTRASAAVRGQQAEVSLGVTMPYPAPPADTVRDVRRHVMERTRELTGFEVPAARIGVTSLIPSAPSRPPVSTSAELTAPKSAPRRRWSQRRVPVALLASLSALGCGALAYDLDTALHWLSGHGLGDPTVVAAGGLTALVGVWMVVLALTPGSRHQYTVRTGADHVDTAVNRSAVAALVRDAVGDVAGVGAVRVRVRRRRIAVRAKLAFDGRARAHSAATAAALDAIDACLLGSDPRLRVTVTPDPVWQPPATVRPAGGAL